MHIIGGLSFPDRDDDLRDYLDSLDAESGDDDITTPPPGYDPDEYPEYDRMIYGY